jgi:uncharacterized alpha-E superfamily protein
MLGKTASGVFWLNRYLERAEASARLLAAGFLIALTRASSAANEWESILTTTGQLQGFRARHGPQCVTNRVVDYLLLDRSNPASVLSMIKVARDNARRVRTALTRELWESINEGWMEFDGWTTRVRDREFPDMIAKVRRYNALIRGASVNTMLRNDIYNFQELGLYIERADNTARLLDVKYYLLLPSVSAVGSAIDIVQWETLLRSVSAHRSYRWQYGSDISALGVARYLILNGQMPRALAFCYNRIEANLRQLASEYGGAAACHALAAETRQRCFSKPMEQIFAEGLHEFISGFLADNNALAMAIESDYRFEPDL